MSTENFPTDSNASELNINQLMQQAVQLHNAGQLEQAEALYIQVLSIDPNHSDALNLAGVIGYQIKNYPIGEELIKRAININPNVPHYYNNLGIIFRAQDKFGEAIFCYQQALALNPNYAEANNNLGTVYQAQKKFDEAILYFQTAIELQPNYIDAFYNLATIYRQQGKRKQAIENYTHVIRLAPNTANAHLYLANLLTQTGELTLAVQHYQTLIELQPDLVDAYYNLGTTFIDLHRYKEATECFQKAIELNPNSAEAYNNLGNVLKKQNRLKEAISHYQKALEINPKLVEVHNNLGTVRMQQKLYTTAVEHLQQAVALKPDYFEAHDNLACAYRQLNRFDEAIAAHRRALDINPNFLEGLNNCGGLLSEINQLEEATDYYQKALALKPNFAEAHFGLSFILLKQGKLSEGFAEAEWRFQTIVNDNYTALQKPRWKGEPLEGKTLLVHWEQGFGDSIQFVRYLPYIQGGKVILACQFALEKLLNNVAGADQVIPNLLQHEPEVEYDTWVSLMSLPHVLNTTLETIPNQVPYLASNPDKIAYWQTRFSSQTFNVGIAWSGNPQHQRDRSRSCALQEFSELAGIEQVQFYSLQKGDAANEAVNSPFPIISLSNELQDFTDTAAVISCLDLVIAVDTVVAHLAGALAKPVWVVLSHGSDWRWLEDKTDSPWYPTMRLFRQSEPGNWHSAFLHIKEALANEVEAHQNNPERLLNQAIELHQAGQFAQAETLYQRILSLQPNHPHALHLLGAMAAQHTHYEKAIALIQQAIAVDNNQPIFYGNLASVLKETGQLTTAIEHYQRALTLAPDYADAYSNLGNLYSDIGEFDKAIDMHRQALKLAPQNAQIHSNLLYALNYMPHYDRAAIFVEHQQFNQQQAVAFATESPSRNAAPNHKLRIGYVSPDLRYHSVAYLFQPVLANHDRSKFEIICYYTGLQQDTITQYLKQFADQWVDCFELVDQALADRIREDKIDILVDLSGHMADNRLLVFARKPAPVQMTFLGYPNTTGLTAIDYHITDNYFDPPEFDAFHSEQPIRLPHSYYTYHPIVETSQVNALPALTKGHLTFGCFNNFAKINADMIALWVKLLQAMPEAQLVVKTKVLQDEVIQQRFKNEFIKYGIAPDRLILGYLPSTEETLAAYRQIDVALDTFPYNGATTTLQALWMGVPVITLAGQTHVSRAGLSILSTLKLSEWITYNPEDYLKFCTKLSNNWAYLQHLRATLRDSLLNSPLMDGKAQAVALEEIYQQVFHAL